MVIPTITSRLMLYRQLLIKRCDGNRPGVGWLVMFKVAKYQVHLSIQLLLLGNYCVNDILNLRLRVTRFLRVRV